MDKPRLLELRRVVLAAPAESFNMNRFCTIRHGCGTAYCAAGLAALDPWFQATTPILSLFRLQPDRNGTFVETRHELVEDVFDGLARLFDISLRNADALFGASLSALDPSTVTPQEVIANIDRLLAGKPAVRYDGADDDIQAARQLMDAEA